MPLYNITIWRVSRIDKDGSRMSSLPTSFSQGGGDGGSSEPMTYLKNSWLAVEELLVLLVANMVQFGVFQVLLQCCQGNGAWKELKR